MAEVKEKWLHVIGICGVTTSGVAIMFKNMGWKVTGSDKGFFDPVASLIEMNGLQVMPGYKPQRLTVDGRHPDLVLFVGVAGSKNPEYLEAKRLDLEITAYAPLLADYVVHPESIVVVGTYGKSTIVSSLLEMFMTAEKTVSYMFGAVARDYKPNVAAVDELTEYSVVEGDEYLTSFEDRESKFFHYSPKYLIFNAAKWDHPDLFPTEESYTKNFEKLIRRVPEDGLIVANANDQKVVDIVSRASCRVVYYSYHQEQAKTNPEWSLVTESKPLPCIIRLEQDHKPLEIIPYEKQIIGNFNEENLLAAAVLAYELGIKKERIQDAIASYQGLKRRLEIVHREENSLIIDDFGSSPPKVKGSLAALRDDYPDAQITVVFEPNTGNRTPESVETYENTFEQADEVIFPRFTKLPKVKDLVRYSEEDLAKKLKEKFGQEVALVQNDDELVEYLKAKLEDQGKVFKIVVFMGSHGFRGMIKQLVSLLK